MPTNEIDLMLAGTRIGEYDQALEMIKKNQEVFQQNLLVGQQQGQERFLKRQQKEQEISQSLVELKLETHDAPIEELQNYIMSGGQTQIKWVEKPTETKQLSAWQEYKKELEEEKQKTKVEKAEGKRREQQIKYGTGLRRQAYDRAVKEYGGHEYYGFEIREDPSIIEKVSTRTDEILAEIQGKKVQPKQIPKEFQDAIKWLKEQDKLGFWKKDKSYKEVKKKVLDAGYKIK